MSFRTLVPTRLMRRFGPAPVAAGVAIALAGCGSVLAVPALPPAASQRPTRSIDRMMIVAKARYAEETGGGKARGLASQIANDPGVSGPLRRGDMPALRSYVRSRFASVWSHQHVSRLRILRGSTVEVDAGVPFVVAPTTRTLRDKRGRPSARWKSRSRM